MSYVIAGALLTLGLVAGMAAFFAIGRRFGRRQEVTGDGAGLGAIDGVVFALLGLLLAFTFSSASARYDNRRMLIVQESNSIGTAYLRIDLLPAAAQPELRELFRRYTQSRLDTYRLLPDLDAATAEYQRSVALQGAIWSKATSAAASMPSPGPLLLITPALNEMFDIAATRVNAVRMHQPPVVFIMLFGLALASALLAGNLSVGGRPLGWLHTTVYMVAVAAAIYVILDLEFPRVGLVQLEAYDDILAGVLAGMK